MRVTCLANAATIRQLCDKLSLTAPPAPRPELQALDPQLPQKRFRSTSGKTLPHAQVAVTKAKSDEPSTMALRRNKPRFRTWHPFLINYLCPDIDVCIFVL